MYCLDPPLDKAPEGEWACPAHRPGQRGRKNEAELLAACAADARWRCARVDFGALPLAAAVRAVRGARALVGVHGAGMMHAAWLREGVGARVVEIFPRAFGAAHVGGGARAWGDMHAFLGERFALRRVLADEEGGAAAPCLATERDEDKRDCNVTVPWEALAAALAS